MREVGIETHGIVFIDAVFHLLTARRLRRGIGNGAWNTTLRKRRGVREVAQLFFFAYWNFRGKIVVTQSPSHPVTSNRFTMIWVALVLLSLVPEKGIYLNTVGVVGHVVATLTKILGQILAPSISLIKY
jgi:hypothetical protein